MQQYWLHVLDRASMKQVCRGLAHKKGVRLGERPTVRTLDYYANPCLTGCSGGASLLLHNDSSLPDYYDDSNGDSIDRGDGDNDAGLMAWGCCMHIATYIHTHNTYSCTTRRNHGQTRPHPDQTTRVVPSILFARSARCFASCRALAPKDRA